MSGCGWLGRGGSVLSKHCRHPALGKSFRKTGGHKGCCWVGPGFICMGASEGPALRALGSNLGFAANCGGFSFLHGA